MKMNIIYDDDSTIVQFKTYEFFAKLFDNAIQKNGDGEIIFAQSGFSSLIGQYEPMITPYRYNGKWENPNAQYNAIKVFLEIFPELDEKHRFLFLKNIIERTNFHRENMTKIENHLALFGLSLIDSDDSQSNYTIAQTTKGMIERGNDVILLEQKLKNDYPSMYPFYDEALSTFGNGEYKSCIDNCRTLYEKITQALTGESTDKSALTLSKEIVTDDSGVQIISKDKIYKYWLDKKKGANRYRYFTTLYSIMSGLGTHGEDVPTKADAVLILRALEDVLVWMMKI